MFNKYLFDHRIKEWMNEVGEVEFNPIPVCIQSLSF